MTYKELKNKIKQEQKELALQIRRGKALRKLKNQTTQTKEEKDFYGDYTNAIWYTTKHLSADYRACHVAYCHFFNKTPIDKIENHVKPGNQFDGYVYQEWIRQWEEVAKTWVKDEETVCAS